MSAAAAEERPYWSAAAGHGAELEEPSAVRPSLEVAYLQITDPAGAGGVGTFASGRRLTAALTLRAWSDGRGPI